MSDPFYRAFGEKFRGSRELIKSRLRVYLPFVNPLLEFYKEGKALDLGCGRGEWLELLQESGFDAQGVDLDDGMLAACRELGLKVQTHEAISFLENLPDASQVIVSGFHLVEHIPFPDLQALVQEALRVLKPGGLLILETPNPENIVVGTSNFYLDPTHKRPIPPALLAFIPEYFGCNIIKVLRLQESAELSKNNAPNLLNVLNGVSPDFAVVAQKDGPEQLLDATKPAFEAEYGLTLEELANRYQQQAEARSATSEAEYQVALAEARTVTSEAKARAALAEARSATSEAEYQVALAEARTVTSEAKARAALAEARSATSEAGKQAARFKAELDTIRIELHEVHQANHHHWQLAEARQLQIQALQNSTSWRLTAPFRKVINMANSSLQLPKTAKSKSKEKVKLMLAHTKLYINRRPRLKRAILNSPSLKFFAKWAMNRYPRFRNMAKNLMGIEGPHMNARSFDNLTSVRIMSSMSKSCSDITNINSVIFLQIPNEK